VMLFAVEDLHSILSFLYSYDSILHNFRRTKWLVDAS
jgi:hypothetical protein